MKTERILVTGGAGFIGSNLVHYLLEKAEHELGVNIEVLVNLDKLTYAGNLANLESLQGDPRLVMVRGDIKESTLLNRLFEEYQFTGVLHLAAESHVDRSIDGPEDFLMTNVVGSFRLLEAARRYHKGLKGEAAERFRFVNVSTDEVYGSLEATDPAFTETTPYAPNSPYSASKAGADHFARAFFHTYHLPVITTNCSNNYGPFQFPEKLLPLMIFKAMHGESLPVYGDGSNVRDWLYVEDHCRGITCAWLRGKPGEVYNIGGRNEKKNIDVVRMILSCLRENGVDCATDELITFVKDRPGHDKRYAIDCTKAQRELGWAPHETFDSGLRRTITWYLKNKEWTENVVGGKYRGERLGV